MQLTRNPWGPVALRILEGIGRPVHTLDVPQHEWFSTASTLDPDDYPFSRAVAGQMREHDDREQFLHGIGIVLTGITTRGPSAI